MRTDEHRPSAIVPQDYEFVAFDYVGPSFDFGMCQFLLTQRKLFREHMTRAGGTYAKHENSGSCHVCGACAFYLVQWYHAKSNSYIQTGEDCARKLEMSYGDMNAFRRVIGDAREAVAGKKKAIAILADAGMARAWEIFEAEYDSLPGKDVQNHDPLSQDPPISRQVYYEETTIRDIVGKLVKYGSISDKQTTFVSNLLNKIDQRPIVEAQRKAEHDAAADCPTGRMRIRGTVVGTKVVADNYSRFGGEKTNIIVKTVEGFKVYGSRFGGVEKGQEVDFTATITPSDRDTKFGFFKRPVQYVDKELAKLLTTIAWG